MRRNPAQDFLPRLRRCRWGSRPWVQLPYPVRSPPPRTTKDQVRAARQRPQWVTLIAKLVDLRVLTWCWLTGQQPLISVSGL